MIYVIQPPTTRIELPDAPNFNINPVRASAARTAVAGNVIRQESALHLSTAEAYYSREIDEDVATALIAAHASSSACALWYRDTQYQATMSLQTFRTKGGKIRVEIRFAIVREGL